MSDSRRIQVNNRQRGNPILTYLTNIPYEFIEIQPDYKIGRTNLFFLSLRYHALKPEYIHERLKESKVASGAVLLLLVDSQDLDNLFNEVNKLCVIAGISLIMAFSNEEAVQYIELLKFNEHKPPDALMGKRPTDLLEAAVEFLTSIKPLNKSDALNLIKTFKTVNNILLADKKSLSLVPGLGQRKIEALHKALQLENEVGPKQTTISNFFSAEPTPLPCTDSNSKTSDSFSESDLLAVALDTDN